MNHHYFTEKQTVNAVASGNKSRPGTFGLASKLNSQPKDDFMNKDEEDEGQKKTTSKSTLEKLLLEEEKRQQTLARESTGSVIYDYDEPVTIPYSVEVHESESVQSTGPETISKNDVSDSQNTEDSQGEWEKVINIVRMSSS
ncbi:hypothetical protein LSTR_LSTR016167 [Laodelphax striatellus]|uniref:Uncharacterized protein n=1 Tax=Laodelphax striatellus TaxID=195883 RepID=A0A482XFL9_LAOST|nr:hypothetical protein LSTR_LSTR016167 [Laodelphax striatellus]